MSTPGSWLWFQKPLEVGDLVPLMYAQGFAMEDCVARLKGRWTANTVRVAWTAEYQASLVGRREAVCRLALGWSAPPKPEQATEQAEERALPSLEIKPVMRTLVPVKNVPRLAAHWLHLLDLKRAGHSPTKTEYVVSTDLEKPAYVSRPAGLASYLGSSALMCAELGQ